MLTIRYLLLCGVLLESHFGVCASNNATETPQQKVNQTSKLSVAVESKNFRELGKELLRTIEDRMSWRIVTDLDNSTIYTNFVTELSELYNESMETTNGSLTSMMKSSAEMAKSPKLSSTFKLMYERLSNNRTTSSSSSISYDQLTSSTEFQQYYSYFRPNLSQSSVDVPEETLFFTLIFAALTSLRNSSDTSEGGGGGGVEAFVRSTEQTWDKLNEAMHVMWDRQATSSTATQSTISTLVTNNTSSTTLLLNSNSSSTTSSSDIILSARNSDHESTRRRTQSNNDINSTTTVQTSNGNKSSNRTTAPISDTFTGLPVTISSIIAPSSSKVTTLLHKSLFSTSSRKVSPYTTQISIKPTTKRITATPTNNTEATLNANVITSTAKPTTHYIISSTIESTPRTSTEDQKLRTATAKQIVAYTSSPSNIVPSSTSPVPITLVPLLNITQIVSPSTTNPPSASSSSPSSSPSTMQPTPELVIMNITTTTVESPIKSDTTTVSDQGVDIFNGQTKVDNVTKMNDHTTIGSAQHNTAEEKVNPALDKFKDKGILTTTTPVSVFRDISGAIITMVFIVNREGVEQALNANLRSFRYVVCHIICGHFCDEATATQLHPVVQFHGKRVFVSVFATQNNICPSGNIFSEETLLKMLYADDFVDSIANLMPYPLQAVYGSRSLLYLVERFTEPTTGPDRQYYFIIFSILLLLFVVILCILIINLYLVRRQLDHQSPTEQINPSWRQVLNRSFRLGQLATLFAREQPESEHHNERCVDDVRPPRPSTTNHNKSGNSKSEMEMFSMYIKQGAQQQAGSNAHEARQQQRNADTAEDPNNYSHWVTPLDPKDTVRVYASQDGTRF